MKGLFLILLLVTVAACDPYGFGFKKNPAYVLDEAFKAVTNLDEESFLEVTGREVLCVYGNKEGIQYLKDKIILKVEDLKINPTVLNSKILTIPIFTGYWTYYSERYQIDIESKTDKDLILKAIVDCQYGADDKDDKWIGLTPREYQQRECRVTKILPKKFAPLPIPKKCDLLKIDL